MQGPALLEGRATFGWWGCFRRECHIWVPFFTRFRDFYYERVNGTSGFRPLAWVEWSQSLATHLGHGKSPGGPGQLPAQGSLRSVRAHISAYGSSNSGFATCCITHPIVAIRLCFVDTLSKARCLRRISQRRFHYSTPRFPPSGRPGRSSPTSQVLSRRSDFLPFVPRRFVAFARRYHGSTRLISFLPTPSRAKRWARGFGNRFPPCDLLWHGNDRISQVAWGPPLSICTCSRTPAGRDDACH